MSASDSTSRTVLGVHVTPQALEAVLLRATDAGTTVLHRMLRPRLRGQDAARSDDFSSVLPGMKSSDDVDFTLEVGEGRSDLDVENPALKSLQQGQPGNSPKMFTAQLREILAECRALGYGSPDLAFCVDAPEVEYVQCTPVDAKQAPEKGPVSTVWEQATAFMQGHGAETRPLLTALKAAYNRPFDPKRVAFLPLASADDEQRHLALVPTEQEAVTPTLRALTSTDETLDFAQRQLDAEASLLARVAAAHVPATAHQNTAVVRVGAENTLLLFLTGTTLQHVDHLRSLTSFDPVETICSRVLLHQDERRIEGIDHVVLVGGPRDGRLADGFATFYDGATIHELTDLLRKDVSISPEVESSLTRESGVAVAAALQLLGGVGQNLFGPAARPRRRATAFAWHTVAVMLMLVGASLFFGWHYMDRQQEIADLKQRLAMSPVPLPELTPEALKSRVDSLNAVHAKHNRALYVLDSLLVGSDEWSRAIERTARQTDQIDGLWLDNWSIDASTIKLQGHALDRNNLAAFARSLDGTVQELKFTDIQGVRAYPFTVTIPRQVELPEVTHKLREEALTPDLQGPSPTQIVARPPTP